MASMKIEAGEKCELILSDVFSGIGIKTDQGRFGIAQRDGGIEIVKDGKIVWSSTPDEAEDKMPTADSNLDVREFDEEDETPDYETKHTWKRIHDRLTCNKCQALWTETNRELSCAIAEGERALTQLGQCLATAEGKGSLGGQGLMRGAYGWSPAFQAVKELWEKLEVANNRVVNIHGTIKKLEGYLLSSGRENERLEEKIKAQDEARAQMSAEYHDLVAGFKRSAEEVKELRVSLEAERAANADKVQAIRTAAVAGDMDRLRDILFPPESDEPESVEEPETKTVVLDAGPDHLKIVEIENVTALRAERDDLKVCLATCERMARDDWTVQGTGAAAIEAVVKLKAERDRIRAAIVGLRDKVLAHLPCVCSENRSICHRHEIAETLDDFERQAGVAEAKGPERDDVTPLKTLEDLASELNGLKESYTKTRNEILARTPCTCAQGGIQWGKPHEPGCPLGVVLTKLDGIS